MPCIDVHAAPDMNGPEPLDIMLVVILYLAGLGLWLRLAIAVVCATRPAPRLEVRTAAAPGGGLLVVATCAPQTRGELGVRVSLLEPPGAWLLPATSIREGFAGATVTEHTSDSPLSKAARKAWIALCGAPQADQSGPSAAFYVNSPSDLRTARLKVELTDRSNRRRLATWSGTVAPLF
jgi:hypothetical protein